MSSDCKFSAKSRIMTWWLGQTVRNKLKAIVWMGVIIVLMSVFLDVWTIKISLFEFSDALATNEKVVNAVQAIENESTGFKNLNRGTVDESEFRKLMSDTDSAIKELPMDYSKIGEERFAWTSSIKNAYSVYRQNCNEFIAQGENNSNYLSDEYMLYDMLDYLQRYSSTLMSLTTVDMGKLYRSMFPEIAIIPVVTIVIAVILIWIIAATSGVVSKTFIDPLLGLASASKRIAENDTDFEDMEVLTKDEIGELVTAFNTMKKATKDYISTLEQNRETIDRLHAEELQKKEIENQLEKMKFEVLRHQINPHFLFNTLNVISGMARLEDAETTEKMIKALSSLFRYNLRNSDKEAPLEQELAVIKDYMYLQSMRFGDRIKYEIDCPAEVSEAYLPSFTLQPLVENSIVHGLAVKEEGGCIRIHAEKTEEADPRLIVTISDTGVGMNEEELARQKQKLDGDSDLSTEIGVGNIYRRLSLMYPESTMEIESEKNIGTTIRISVPFTKNMEEV